MSRRSRCRRRWSAASCSQSLRSTGPHHARRSRTPSPRPPRGARCRPDRRRGSTTRRVIARMIGIADLDRVGVELPQRLRLASPGPSSRASRCARDRRPSDWRPASSILRLGARREILRRVQLADAEAQRAEAAEAVVAWPVAADGARCRASSALAVPAGRPASCRASRNTRRRTASSRYGAALSAMWNACQAWIVGERRRRHRRPRSSETRLFRDDHAARPATRPAFARKPFQAKPGVNFCSSAIVIGL